MARTLTAPHGVGERLRKTNGFMLASMVTLAAWRFRRTWFLLLVTTLGMVAAVIIACSVPLFTSVTDTAGLRETLRATPYNSEVNLTISPFGMTSQVVNDIHSQLNPTINTYLAPYMSQPPTFEIQSSSFNISSPVPSGPNQLTMYAESMQQAASHITLEQGRLPHTVSFINGTQGVQHEIEAIITSDMASSLGLHVGSVMTLGYSFYKKLPSIDDQTTYTRYLIGVPVLAHVVGIFHVAGANIDYWHGVDFTSHTVFSNGGKLIIYSMLTNASGLLQTYDDIAKQYQVKATFTIFGNFISWYYHVDPTHVSISNLNTIVQRTTTLKKTIDTQYGSQESYDISYSPDSIPPYPYIYSLQLFSPLFPQQLTDGTNGTNGGSILSQFEQRIQVARIPAFIISIQIVALLLFFVSLMTDLLVDRQSDAIAIIRSRGASRSQIFGALMTQSVVLGLFALLIGLPLTVLVVLLVSKNILPSSVQDALNVVTAHPLQALFSAVGYAIAVVLVILLTMGFSLARASRMDVLSTRRQSARATRRPLWQRLHLDIVLGAVALAGYLVALYLSTIGNVLSDTTKVIVSVLFNLVSPYFLILLFLLVFLRLFPYLLGLAARIATRGRSAASMLALAQMARSPRQAVRMTTLLALAITFAIFSLVLTATQAQRASDIASFRVGSDFAATLPETTNAQSLTGMTKQFDALPGVLSASVGYVNTGTVGSGSVPLTFDIRAVDTSTYGNTAIWPTQASLQSVKSLMNTLNSASSYGIAHGLVPIIVDANSARIASLHIGSTITISQQANTGSLLLTDLHCYVVGIINNIPTTNVNPQLTNTGYYNQIGGLLMDYQTYNTIYQQQLVQSGQGKGSVALNYVWVHSKSDPTSISRVRSSLAAISSSLFAVQDRRSILDSLNADPLILTLVGILSIGTVSTLLLALLGDLLASWLSARTRLTNFVVLRALGTSPRQVAGVLTWEQGLIYLSGIVLGIAFGILLATTVIPTLVYYAVGSQIPLAVHTIVPISLIVTLALLILVFVVTLGMMVRVVSSPSMSQTLRLNED